MPSARQYELVYIVAPTATDADVEALQAEVTGLVQKLGGTVGNTDVWGRRKLAYEIGHHTEGIYIVQLLDGPAEMVSELGRRLRVRDQVLRYLTGRVDEDLRKSRRVVEKRKATVRRRRAARGKPPLPEVADTPAADASPAAASAGGYTGGGDAGQPTAAPDPPPAEAAATDTSEGTSEVHE